MSNICPHCKQPLPVQPVSGQRLLRIAGKYEIHKVGTDYVLLEEGIEQYRHYDLNQFNRFETNNP